MIRRNQAFLNRLNVLLDLLLVIAAYMLASWFWLGLLEHSSENMAAVNRHTLIMSGIYAACLILLMLVMGFYGTTRTRGLKWKLRVILIAVTVVILLASALLFAFRLVDFSRGVMLCFYFFTLLLLSGKYMLMRYVFGRMRAKGYNLKHIVVIGTGDLARQFAEDAEGDRSLGFHVMGFVGSRRGGEKRYLGGFDKLDTLLESPDVSEAVIALSPEEYPHIRSLIASCEKNGVKYSIIPFYNDVIPANPLIETVGRSKLINMRVNRLETVEWAVLKRAFDMLASGLGLIVLSPLMLGIAVAVKLSSPGPVLFRQTRVGYQRREFTMYKFRSMRVNGAEDTAWTTDADSRRTRFGSLIRKTSLDELPQLWNVFRGDMSLVGPRPELPHFVEQFRESVPLYMVKHQVMPGITGWAQINGYRGDTSIAKRIELDLWYIDHWSVWLDLKIMFRTLFGGMLNHEIIDAPADNSRQAGL